MSDSPTSYPLSYCTNVHPGADFDEMFHQLGQYAPRVRDARSQRGPLGLGLWFSRKSIATSLLKPNIHRLQGWLDDNRFEVYTANAFPFGDFHQPVVKHAVYEPTWAADERAEYTRDVFRLLHALAPNNREISASTLPLGWPQEKLSDEFFRKAAKNLLSISSELAELELTSGRLAYLCLEPEPGCLLDSSEDVAQFFERWIWPATQSPERVARHLRVCHDICHSAVMFESQAEALDRLRSAGIAVGKVQVSAALEADFTNADATSSEPMIRALESFCEPRYLHQTVVSRPDKDLCFYEDLPQALLSETPPFGSRWRVHFHVPVHWSAIGAIRSTQPNIAQFMSHIQNLSQTPLHYEVETYAWNILPANLASADLATGIANELDWFDALRSSRSKGEA